MSPSFTYIHIYIYILTHTDEDDDGDKPKEKEKGYRMAEKVETKSIPPPKWGKTKGKTDRLDLYGLMETLIACCISGLLC